MSQTDGNQGPNLDMSAYRELFVDESLRFLATLRQSLYQLTDDPTDHRANQEARRAAHTLRGMASTMHYQNLAALGRSLESQFQSESPLTSDQIDVLLAGCDEFEAGLARLERKEAPEAQDDEC
jgi:two-component system chemotaxis sensor kinase CheA